MKKLMWCLMSVLGLIGTAHADLAMFKTHTFQSAAGATGNGTPLAVDNYSTVGLQVVISDTATVTFEVTSDGTNWASAVCTASGDTAGTLVTTASASAAYQCNIAGYQQFRARVSSFTGGTITVTGRATTAVLGRKGGGGSGVASSITGSDTLPAEPCTVGQVYSEGDSLSASFFYCADGTWQPVGGSPPASWPSDTTVKSITTADSYANRICIGNICFYDDPTNGPTIRPNTDMNTRTSIWDGFTYGWRDVEGDADMFVVDPDATENDKYTWQAGYRPIKTISFPADSLYPLGSASVLTNAALVSGGLVAPYLTVTDSNSDGFYRYYVMDPKWDGGTVTATVTVVNVNGTPANAFEVDVSGECYPAGTVVATSISTTGEQPATITFGSSGSCGGSACNQNDPASATTAAITINGTPAGGNLCAFQAQVDATATTETVAGIKVVQMDIHYKIAKGF